MDKHAASSGPVASFRDQEQAPTGGPGSHRSSEGWKSSSKSFTLPSRRLVSNSEDNNDSGETAASRRQLFAAIGATNRRRLGNQQGLGESSDDVLNFFSDSMEQFGSDQDADNTNELKRMLEGSGEIKLFRTSLVAFLLIAAVLVSALTYMMSMSSQDEVLRIEGNPILSTILVLLLFAIAMALLLRYNCLVEERQERVLRQAINSTLIVSSLFPEGVHDRLLETTSMGISAIQEYHEDEEDDHSTDSSRKSGLKGKGPKLVPMNPATRESASLNGESKPFESKPIADFFPNCTVMVSATVSVRVECKPQALTKKPYSVFRHCWVHCLELLSQSNRGFHSAGIDLQGI